MEKGASNTEKTIYLPGLSFTSCEQQDTPEVDQLGLIPSRCTKSTVGVGGCSNGTVEVFEKCLGDGAPLVCTRETTGL